SLAGYVVISCRPDLVQNFGREHYQLPASWAEHELSATAIPIMYTNHIAGCVLVSSAQPDYFNSSSRRTLIGDYTQLIALAFKPEQFYPPEWIELQVLPSFDVQRGLLASFREQPEQAIPKLHDVLDIGCGPRGLLLEMAYANSRLHATGIDVSQGMIDYASALASANELDNAQFHVANAIDPLGFPDGTFDL